MKKIGVKYFVVGMLLILEIVSLTLMYKSSHNKEVVLDEVKLKDLIKNDMISIMTDETGKGTYTEYTTSSSTWPSSSKYKYNSDKSQCINEKGSVVNNVLTFDGTRAILTSDEGMHCTLYFDKIIGPLATLRENDDENQITGDLVGGMYRYQGTDGVNNWICFGTNDKSKCITEEGIDKYMYRIIGVMSDGQLALIKETGVKVGSTKTFQWNEIFKQTATDCGEDGSKCIWIKSKIYNRLNGLCKSSNVNCKGTTSGTDGNTNIFIGNSNYDYLNTGNSWFNLINDYTWKYGDVTGKFSRVEGQYEISYGDDAYKLESALNTTISAKIGLMYIHDYLYAFPDGKEIRGEMPWININKDVNSQQSLSEWIISRRPMNGDITAWFINEVAPHSTALVNGASVRPVFYLKPDIVLESGSTGSKSNPYIIAGMPSDVDNPPVIRSITTENVNAHSIKISVSASDDKIVSNYCYAIQKGVDVNVTSEETCGGNTKEFTGLDQATAYTIKVRVVDSAKQEATEKKTINTNALYCSFNLTYRSGKIAIQLTYPTTISVSSYKIDGKSNISEKTIYIDKDQTGTINGEITDTSGNVASCSVKTQGRTSSGYCLSCGSGSSTGGASGGFAAFFSTSKECDEYRSQYSGSSGGATWGGSCLCNSCTGCATDYNLLLDSDPSLDYNVARCYKITS